MDEDNILLRLLENPIKVKERKTTFTWITQNRNRNSCQKELKEYIEKGWVREEPENWKRGQKKWYILTEKGMEECSRLVCGNVTRSFKALNRFSTGLLSNPTQQREQLLNYTNEVWNRVVKKTENMDSAQKKLAFRINDILTKPLENICLDIHNALCYLLRGQADPAEYTTIIEKDKVHLELTSYLKEYTNLFDFLHIFFSQSEIESMRKQSKSFSSS